MKTKHIAKYLKNLSPEGRMFLFDHCRDTSSVTMFFEGLRGACDEQADFFNRLREKSYRFAETIVARSSVLACPESFRLTGIDITAKAGWRYQWKPLFDKDPHGGDRYFTENWFEERCLRYGKRGRQAGRIIAYPHHFWFGRFEAAIWQGNTLCGLSVGGGSELHKDFSVSIEVTEGHPHAAHPLKSKIYDISLIAAAAYADILGFKTFSRSGPFSEGSLKQAECLGLVGKEELAEWREYGSCGREIVVPVDRVVRDGRYLLGRTGPTPT